MEGTLLRETGQTQKGGFLKNRLKSGMGIKHPERLEEEGLVSGRGEIPEVARKGVTRSV